jgi:two-component system, OmpR family, KDP operon response regulator KdpE
MTSRPLILIVDDEPQIQRFLGHALAASGYDTCFAATAHEGLKLTAHTKPAAIILDLGLPDLNGKAVIERLRAKSNVPIIVLSAHDQEMEKIMALDLGANDFVAKPFGIGELLARLRSCLRQSPRESTGETIRQGSFLIDLAAHTLTINDQSIRLTPKEFDLLVTLARNPGRVLTHRQLLLQVWGPAHGEDVPYLRVFIGQLRQKIEAEPSNPQFIQTEPGIGYRWVRLE